MFENFVKQRPRVQTVTDRSNSVCCSLSVYTLIAAQSREAKSYEYFWFTLQFNFCHIKGVTLLEIILQLPLIPKHAIYMASYMKLIVGSLISVFFQYKATHRVVLSWFATPVSWMDYLGKAKVFMNTDFNKFVLKN